MKKVFSIIVSYNGIAWIEKCLNSLLSSSYLTQIVVIDNGSSDSTVSVIRNHFPLVRLIETKENLGFGRANNIGMKLAIESGADYIFLLNQDAWVETGTIATLVKVQDDNPLFGIVSPVHLNGAGNALDKNFLEYFAQSHLKEFAGSILLRKEDIPTLIETDFVNAAAWMISAECLKKTGGFDPIFFHYGEDINYSQRVLNNGFKIGIATTTQIYHDREDRNSAITVGIIAEVKHEWTQFLNHVCDVKNSNYQWSMLKRGSRHILLTAKYLFFFNRHRLQYNYEMMKRIVTSLPGISKSRRIALSDKPFAHL